MRNILWINPKWPLPAEDGARKATVDLLRSLTLLGENIYLVSISAEQDVIEIDCLKSSLGVKEAFAIPRNGSSITSRLFSLITKPWLPLTVSPYATGEISLKINDIIQNRSKLLPKKWDVIVYDGLHPAAHASKFGIFIRPETSAKLIYRAHNRETDIWKRKATATKNPIFSLLLAFQAVLVKRFEDSVVKGADATATVSAEDLNSFKNSIPNLNGAVVPIGFPFDSPPPFPVDTAKLQIMFLGRLDWLPNKQGLIWFLNEVWPTVIKQRKDLKLVIAGSGDSDWLTAFNAEQTFQFLGRVESLDELYKHSIISLVPIFYGSGTRVKAIEAAKYGRGCLSTALGVEGIGLNPTESYLQAETKEEWISALCQINLDQCKQLGSNAHALARQNFESLSCAKKFQNLLVD